MGSKTVDFIGKGLDTIFKREEREYYLDFHLYINPNGTFNFSKPFFNEQQIINGNWTIHNDPLSLTILLRDNDRMYYSHMAMCENNNTFVDIAIQNKHYLKRLPLKKINNK